MTTAKKAKIDKAANKAMTDWLGHSPANLQRVREAAERVSGVVSTWHDEPSYKTLSIAPKEVLTAWRDDLQLLTNFALASVREWKVGDKAIIGRQATIDEINGEEAVVRFDGTAFQYCIPLSALNIQPREQA